MEEEEKNANPEVNGGEISSQDPLPNVTEGIPRRESENQEDEDYDFPDLFRPIYNPKLRTDSINERFTMSPQEYLGKVGVYLQDALKLLFDRKEERPLDILTDYFVTAAKGEHILLRDYAFICGSEYNKRSFLQQIKKVFHTSPYYKIITALDYHQMLCLICSDFPRSLIMDAIQILPLAKATPNNTINQQELTPDNLIFGLFSLRKLQRAVALFFFYYEFMENVKTVFQELNSGTFALNDVCSIRNVFTSIQNLLKRSKPHTAPAIEWILEALAAKSGIDINYDEKPVILVEDVIASLSGKISYTEFCQYMSHNSSLHLHIFKPVYDRNTTKTIEQLKELAVDHVPIIQQPKKLKKKKKF